MKRDLTGQVFERWTVIKEDKDNPYSNSRWICRCSCGRIKPVMSSTLLSGISKSCGCLRREISAERMKTHGHAYGGRTSKTYNSWASISQRCENKDNKAYSNYGGRGINVCERWKKFENFLEDMGERPDGKTLDRIDNDGNYEPTNCRWATKREQANNRCKRRWWKNPKAQANALDSRHQDSGDLTLPCTESRGR